MGSPVRPRLRSWVVRAAALTGVGLALGCYDEDPYATKDLDVGQVEDTGVDVPLDRTASDAGIDVPADRGGDVPTDRGVDVPVDRPAEVSIDVPADRPADVSIDVLADVVTDGVIADGGYAVAEVTAAAPSVRGGAALSVDATLLSECGANEVAVGIAVSVEGRSYVADARLECAALDATGLAFATPHWAGDDPPADWSRARCPAGQHVIGILGAGGDIIDRLGAQCAALGWTTTDTRTPLGPWGGTATDRAEACPPSSAVQRLAISQVTYFGGTTALTAEARCRRVAPR